MAKRKSAPKRRALRREEVAGRVKAPKRQNRRKPGKATSIEPAARPQEAVPQPDKQADVTVVGIGASAGGLEAFSQMLENLPTDTGLAVVLVQHLAPHYESALPALLASKTRLPVDQVTDGMKLRPDHVYVIPPNVQMGVVNGSLNLVPRPDDRTQYNPIDYFFHSLAEDAGSRAIGVVLSGTASDGSLGLREIKAVGGITIAQEPETAKYDGMPVAAITTGAVDLVLAPAAIGAELALIAEHPYVRRAAPPEPGGDLDISEAQFGQIFALLRSASGVDFTHYKSPTIRRRLHRRMALHKITSVGQYIRYLQEHPPEAEKLYQDILINVTQFFREPDAFETLTHFVLPEMVKHHRDASPIRIWVPGCATGEEAYSLAITALEFFARAGIDIPLQIFATDISEPAIERARSGSYPLSIETDVAPERLRRYFSKVDGSYRINKSIRELCVFARQDVTRDPPFSKLDLIVCRNVLIYLGSVLQRKLMSIFHYALRPWGYLLLGSAETVGLHGDLFAVADKKHRLYTKKGVETKATLSFPTDYAGARATLERRGTPAHRAEMTAQHEASRVLLERYSPPAVLVDHEYQIIQFRGQTGPFLEPAPGEASLNLLKMAREGLLYGLRAALGEARKGDKPARKAGLKVKRNGYVRQVNLEVVPLNPGSGERHYLVLFEEVRGVEKTPAAPEKRIRPTKREENERIAGLEQELAANREYLQSVIQDLEAANEELQSANEEILSSNEELQSSNEELDTAKEELQSSNEELNTVNEEMHSRNEEITRINSDLLNLLANVDVAIVMVARDLRIRRFTPMAEKILNLIPADVGRPIGQIKPNIDCHDLEAVITEVIDTVSTRELEVRDQQGRRYSLRVRPYKDLDSRIDGAVLTLFDITALRESEERERQLAFAESIVETVREPLIVLDGDLRVRTANAAFYKLFRNEPSETEGAFIYDLGNRQWNIPALRRLLEEILPANSRFADFEVDHEFPSIGHKRMLLNARQIEGDGGRPSMILLAMEDKTDEGRDARPEANQGRSPS